jgi:hypothetical protein
LAQLVVLAVVLLLRLEMALLGDYSALGGWLNASRSTDVVVFNISNHWSCHHDMTFIQRYISIYIRRNQGLHQSYALLTGD